jgi:hypothetical protein
MPPDRKRELTSEVMKIALGAVAGAMLAGASMYPTVDRHEASLRSMDAMAVAVARMEVQLEEVGAKLSEMHAREMRRLEGGSGR